MRSTLIAVCALLTASALLPAETAWSRGKLDRIELEARLLRDVDKIEQLLGDRLDEEFVLVELRVTPLYGETLELERQDFRLRSRADNDSSEAQSPERIAGSAVLALDTRTTGGGGLFSQSGGPVIGGAPGTGTRPRRLGNRGTTLGSSGLGEGETTLSREQREESDLVARLTELELPLTGDDVVTGYLYFQVDPNVKLKRYVFYYDGGYGELKLEFDK